MNRLRCLLSGGHRYSPAKIVTRRNHIDNTIVLHNFCVKCSRMITFEMPAEVIDNEIKKGIEKQFFRWSYDERQVKDDGT